jgi:non-ribosomal peptide synthetase component F
VATVGEDTAVPVPVLDAPDPEGASRLIRDLAAEGFDLAAGPLLRAVLVRVGGRDWVLGIAVHHIAVDGWSMALLLNEVGRRYRGEPAKPLPSGVPATREDDGFWRDTLSGARAVSLGSGHRGWDGVAGDLEVPVELAARIRDYAARQHATPFMVLLSALAVVLAHRTGQTDLVIGTPAAGRDVGNANATGLFVNTLPIRIDVSGQPDFATLLGRVRTACLGAYAHQQVPFERVLRAAGAPSSLVGVCLSFQNLPFAPWQQDGLSAEPFELPVPGAQFELTVTLAHQPDGSLRGHTVHAADLVDAETIATLRTELVAVLEAGTSGVGHPLPLPAAAPFELVPLSAPEPVTMVGPRDEVEATLAGIWCEVIDLPEVSVTAPFFELGGHSLQAARILARVESAFGVRVPVAELLTTGTTIEHLATIIRADADPEVDDAVAALGQLSHEEIADLLQGGRA